ncbi:MAG: hypothetical protein FJZ93_09970 [Chloroflexi bacterium]|nr:hypothetical protein [Chloroflexota bacterium]
MSRRSFPIPKARLTAKIILAVAMVAILLIACLGSWATVCMAAETAASGMAGKLTPAQPESELTEFSSAQYGLTLQYPKKWANIIPVRNPDVLLAVNPAPFSAPVLIIAASGEVETRKAVMASLEAFIDGNLGRGSFRSSRVGFLSESACKTADGTPAEDVEFGAEYGNYPVKGLATVARKSDLSIVVIVATVEVMSPYNRAEYSKIAHSLRFVDKSATRAPEQTASTGQPAAPTPRLPSVVSFVATEYRNPEYGFKVRYPLSWQAGKWGDAESDRRAGMLLVALGAGTQRLVVGARQGTTLANTLTAVFKDAGARGIVVDRASDTTLRDGTLATWIAHRFSGSAGMSLVGNTVGTRKGDTWIFVTVACGTQKALGSDFVLDWNAPLFAEILSTLEFETPKVAEEKPAPKPEPADSGSSPTETTNGESTSPSGESELDATKLGSLPPYILIAMYVVLGVTAAIVAFFFVFRLQRRRRAEAFARTKEAYEKKLVQWEKEGYDVDEYKKKWFKKK